MKLTFPLALFLLFLGLKLGGVIAWSWLWVTAPLWIGLALIVIPLVFAAGFAAICGVFIAFASLVSYWRR